MADLEINIGGTVVSTNDPQEVPLKIDYQLEDTENFQEKKSSSAVDIVIPASLINQQAAGSFQNVRVTDMSYGEAYHNPLPAVIKARGMELLVGKALLQESSETDVPEDFTWNFYGDNADWMLDLADKTLFDFVHDLRFTFSKEVITNSWAFDGRNEALPYVFAPVRYRSAFGLPDVQGNYDDYNMTPDYMKPALSKYWILYWGFRSLGYRIQSDFFNTDFFRRQVMPWTWGNFLYSDGTRLENLDFLAKSTSDNKIHPGYVGYVDLLATNDSKDGAFDNNDVYTYDAAQKAMIWEYKPLFNYGPLDATFKLSMFVSYFHDITTWNMKLEWYKISGGTTTLVNTTQIMPGIIQDFADYNDIMKLWQTVSVQPGDKVMAKIYVEAGGGTFTFSVDGFELAYFRIPMGGTIDFENYTAFKKYKFLDFLRGVVDEFNLSVKTDVTNKVIVMEPTHPYQLPGEAEPRNGFFVDDYIDWADKRDLTKKATMRLFNEGEREVYFNYKNDSNDGIQKVVQDRYSSILAQGKYVLPERFKAGKKTYENRFFSATMHYTVAQWKKITGTAPNMVCIIPENISNTSNSESESTLLPKSAYYKGIIPGLGWVFDGVELHSFPYMFAVNYLSGGEDDPVLSYGDERIGDEVSGTTVEGLMKRFFLQRLANIRNGQWYTGYFKISGGEASQPWHREYKVFKDQRWELIQIDGYTPLKDDTTKCVLRKWAPIMRVDFANSYPSESSVRAGHSTGPLDTKYSPLKGLSSDIPH